jgi:hypothetical protein
MSIFSIAHYLLSSFHGHRGLTESLYSGFRLTYVKGKINSSIKYFSCRRRGKNKGSAQNCRKRKIKQIEELQIMIGRTSGLSFLIRIIFNIDRTSGFSL